MDKNHSLILLLGIISKEICFVMKIISKSEFRNLCEKMGASKDEHDTQRFLAAVDPFNK